MAKTAKEKWKEARHNYRSSRQDDGYSSPFSHPLTEEIDKTYLAVYNGNYYRGNLVNCKKILTESALKEEISARWKGLTHED